MLLLSKSTFISCCASITCLPLCVTAIFFLRGFAKKTLLKTARKAGFKPKQSSKRQKYVLPNMSMITSNKFMTSPGRMSLPVTDNNDLSHDDDLSGEFKIKFLSINYFNISRGIYTQNFYSR